MFCYSDYDEDWEGMSEDTLTITKTMEMGHHPPEMWQAGKRLAANKGGSR